MANALGITELTDTQAGKYLTVNNMVKYLSALMTGVRDIPTSPPGSPVENGAYIIGSGGNTGAWSSFAVNDLVFYLGSAWYKLPPIEGLRVWVWDEDACYVYSGSAWAREPQEVGERLLARVTVNVQNGDAKTTIYTVPTGKKLVVTRVVIRNPSGSMAGGTDFDLGDGANADTWVNAIDLSGLGPAQYRVISGDNANFTVFDAGDEFGIKPVTGATADVTATAELFGYLYDA
jgi:hypothetical protein